MSNKKLNMFLKLPQEVVEFIKISAIKDNKSYSKFIEDLVKERIGDDED